MNDTACLLHIREISSALKTFSPLQRIWKILTIFLTDKKDLTRALNFSFTSSGQGYLCLPVLGKISHGMYQNGHRNVEYLQFWLWPPMTMLLGIAGKVWIHRTPEVIFLQVHFREIHKLQYCQVFPKEAPCWITAHHHAHPPTIDYKSPMLSQEEMHNQWQEKQILHFSCLGIDSSFTGTQTMSVWELLLPY